MVFYSLPHISGFLNQTKVIYSLIEESFAPSDCQVLITSFHSRIERIGQQVEPYIWDKPCIKLKVLDGDRDCWLIITGSQFSKVNLWYENVESITGVLSVTPEPRCTQVTWSFLFILNVQVYTTCRCG